MSTLTYNGITINLPTIASFNTTPVYDEADQGVIANKTVITVTGLIDTGSAFSNAAIATTIANYRKALTEPKKNLVVNIGGTDVYNITAPDDANGPKPRKCEFHDIVGSSFIKVDFEVEITQAECNSGSCSAVLGHRWSVTHSMDQEFYTTRTLTGTLTLRQSAAANNPDVYRGTVTPKIPAGFIRQSMEFLITPDNLTLKYTIVDRQVYRVFPSPCTSCQADFTVQASQDGGWMYYNNFNCTVTGTKAASKMDLFVAAVSIGSKRVSMSNETGGETLIAISIQEILYENALRVQLTTRVPGQELAGTNSGDLSIPLPKTTKLFTDVPQAGNAVDPGPYGTSLLAAAKALFYDHCDGTSAALAATTQTGQSYAPVVSTGVITPPASSPPDSTNPSKQNPSQATYAYLLFKESFTYKQDNAAVLLPSSKPGVGPIAYQIHDPTAVIIQSGMAIRYGKAPDVPAPAHRAGETSIVADRLIQENAPELTTASAQLLYSTVWGYTILIGQPGGNSVTAGNFRDTPDDLSLKIPANPITTTPATTTDTPTGYKITP